MWPARKWRRSNTAPRAGHTRGGWCSSATAWRSPATAAANGLFDVPGYRFQALVTSLPTSQPPLAVWRYYNGRADCENVIKELRKGFALPTLCLRSFWATEAALSLATLTYNLSVLFQRHLGWQKKVTIHTLRFWLFVTAGVLSHS